MFILEDLQRDWAKYNIIELFRKNTHFTPMFVVLTGSRLTATSTPLSDIDIIVYTKELTEQDRLPFKFEYNHLMIHGWYRTFKFNPFQEINNEFAFGLIFNGLRNANNYIWIDPKYQKGYDLYVQYAREFENIALHLILEKNRDLILWMIKENRIFYKKDWYALIYGYYHYNHQKIPLDWLKKIKNNKYKYTTEDKNIILDLFKKMLDDHSKNFQYIQDYLSLINAQEEYLKTID